MISETSDCDWPVRRDLPLGDPVLFQQLVHPADVALSEHRPHLGALPDLGANRWRGVCSSGEVLGVAVAHGCTALLGV